MALTILRVVKAASPTLDSSWDSTGRTIPEMARGWEFRWIDRSIGTHVGAPS